MYFGFFCVSWIHVTKLLMRTNTEYVAPPLHQWSPQLTAPLNTQRPDSSQTNGPPLSPWQPLTCRMEKTIALTLNPIQIVFFYWLWPLFGQFWRFLKVLEKSRNPRWRILTKPDVILTLDYVTSSFCGPERKHLGCTICPPDPVPEAKKTRSE